MLSHMRVGEPTMQKPGPFRSLQVLSTRLPEHIRCFASSVAAKGILPLSLSLQLPFSTLSTQFRDISDDASGL